MIRNILMATVVSFALATPAMAAHCPKDAAAIDAYLAKMSVSDTLKAEVIALKDKGMELHSAGNHRESEAVLADAMRKLLTAQ